MLLNHESHSACNFRLIIQRFCASFEDGEMNCSFSAGHSVCWRAIRKHFRFIVPEPRCMCRNIKVQVGCFLLSSSHFPKKYFEHANEKNLIFFLQWRWWTEYLLAVLILMLIRPDLFTSAMWSRCENVLMHKQTHNIDISLTEPVSKASIHVLWYNSG